MKNQIKILIGLICLSLNCFCQTMNINSRKGATIGFDGTISNNASTILEECDIKANTISLSNDLNLKNSIIKCNKLNFDGGTLRLENSRIICEKITFGSNNTSIILKENNFINCKDVEFQMNASNRSMSVTKEPRDLTEAQLTLKYKNTLQNNRSINLGSFDNLIFQIIKE